jgi:dCTP deaminase
MILSDREIKLAIARGQVQIAPRPSEDAWASTAVDLRLDAELLLWKVPSKQPGMNIDPCFCPAADEFNIRDIIKQNTEPHDLRKEPFKLPPGRFILGWTREKLRLPHESRICARVEGKSSLARLGLGIHVTAPTIHAGFGVSDDPEGNALQLEIWNVGPLPIQLQFEMPICQLIFEEVHGTPEKGYRGQFIGQGPKPPA